MPHEKDRGDVDQEHDRRSESRGVLRESELLVDVGGHVAQEHVEGDGVEAGNAKGDEGIVQMVSKQQA